MRRRGHSKEIEHILDKKEGQGRGQRGNGGRPRGQGKGRRRQRRTAAHNEGPPRMVAKGSKSPRRGCSGRSGWRGAETLSFSDGDAVDPIFSGLEEWHVPSQKRILRRSNSSEEINYPRYLSRPRIQSGMSVDGGGRWKSHSLTSVGDPSASSRYQHIW